MKQRLNIGLDCYVVLQGGVLRGRVVKSMNRGQYSVETFLGNVTVTETKIFKQEKFMEACQTFQNLYGVK